MVIGIIDVLIIIIGILTGVFVIKENKKKAIASFIALLIMFLVKYMFKLP